MRNSSLFLVLLLVLGAQACGLKGPLYLPDPAKEVTPVEDKDAAEKEKAKKKAEQAANPTTTPSAPPAQQR